MFVFSENICTKVKCKISGYMVRIFLPWIVAGGSRIISGSNACGAGAGRAATASASSTAWLMIKVVDPCWMRLLNCSSKILVMPLIDWMGSGIMNGSVYPSSFTI